MKPQITCVADTRSTLGEGAVWDGETQTLWWVDIKGHLVHNFDPNSGKNASFNVGEPVGSLAIRKAGDLVIATQSGIYLFDPASGDKVHVTDPEAHLSYNRFNDGTTDRQGRFWAGTMRDDGTKEQNGSFYRFDPDLQLRKMIPDFWTPNGLAFSPDGKTMYAAESHADVRSVWAFDYDTDTGTPMNRRVFLDTVGMAGRPDGATVDADGCYWLAAIDSWQVWRITPDGKIDLTIDLPIERPTKPMWGGKNLDTLYVTSLSLGLDPSRPQPQAGSLFAITGTGYQGVPEVKMPF
jgi:sugar lactone lactonase YvrE